MRQRPGNIGWNRPVRGKREGRARTSAAKPFLSPSAMLQHNLAIGSVSVCPSVCPSTYQYWLKTNDRRIIWFSLSGSARTLAFLYHLPYARSRWNPLSRASNETGMGKNGENVDFRPIYRYISEMVADRHTVTMEYQ